MKTALFFCLLGLASCSQEGLTWREVENAQREADCRAAGQVPKYGATIGNQWFVTGCVLPGRHHD